MQNQPRLHDDALLDDSVVKEIKLQLPVRTHIRLRAQKLLHGETIVATVNAALERYFQDRRAEEISVEFLKPRVGAESVEAIHVSDENVA